MSTASKPLQNIYYERKVATDKPCYICKRFTTTVLATIDTKDFLYTCEGHLGDKGFATLINPPTPTPSGPSQADIQKVISDYKSREAKKANGNKDEKGKETLDDSREPPPEPLVKPTSTPPALVPGVAAPGTGTSTPGSGSGSGHRKYALHRQIFEMRQNEIKRKEMGIKAREVGKGMPQVPRGMF